MKFQIARSGRYSLTGEKISIQDAIPFINGQAIAPVSVETEDHSILYHLAQGDVRVELKQDGEDVILRCRLEQMSRLHDVQPVGNGLICGADRIFTQGFGMEGPSGVCELADGIHYSDGLAGLIGGDCVLFGWVEDHRCFRSRFMTQPQTELFGTSAGFAGAAEEGCICLNAGFNLEGTRSGDVELPQIHFSEKRDLQEGLKEIAGKIATAMGARNVQPPAYHWSSWYYLYQNLTQPLLEEYLGGLKEEPFRYIQIDAGYAPSHGDWLEPNERFPEGMKKAAQTILQAGFLPAIWVGVFMVGDHSKLFREHPDWMLRGRDGKPYVKLRSYNEPKAWGYPDSNYYVLDTSHPEALSYIKNVFSTLHDWGFRLFKTDFLLWNMVDTSQVQRYDSTLTSIEILRRTLQTIRDAIGQESYLLECIAPFMCSIGFADGMRIAGDVGAQWQGEYGPLNLIREMQADNYFNNIFWQNDPDAMILRDREVFLTDTEIRSLALMQALSGGIVTTSEDLRTLSEDRRQLLHFLRPAAERKYAHFPFLGSGRKDLVITHCLEQGQLLYVLNTTDEPMTVAYSFKELFGETYRCVRLWEGCKGVRPMMPGATGSSGQQPLFAATLAPHASALLFLTDQPMETSPDNIWNW